jgi:cytochrome c biogenesis protein CcmG/thiol:disulfide interchange protein DsbE
MTEPATAAPPRRRFNAGLLLGVGFIAAIFVALAAYQLVNRLNGGSAAKAPLAETARKPAQLAMPTLDGGRWSLADHAGEVALINYFATWCPPCRHELPDLRKIAGEYKPRGVVFAAVSIDRDGESTRSRTELLQDFNRYENLPFPILLPPPESPLLREQMAIPQTILIDKKGRIALHITGMVTAEKLRPVLDQLLAEP